MSASLGFLKTPLVELGESGINLGKSLLGIVSGQLDIPETVYQMYRSLVNAAPIVIVAATFIGMALAIQIARELVVTYGAARFVGGMITVSIVREIGPVFTAVAVAGNMGSAIAAEIATMKVTEQIDALRVFRIDPIRYLVTPRLIATSLITPMLGILGATLAILMGMLISGWIVNIAWGLYLDSAQSALTVRDIAISFFKSLCFGIAIAVIACSFGLKAQGSAEAVGTATTRAVVWGLLSIFFINYLITSLFYELTVQ